MPKRSTTDQSGGNPPGPGSDVAGSIPQSSGRSGVRAPARRKKPEVPGAAWDQRVAQQVKTLAGQGTDSDRAARFLGFNSADDLLKVYSKEWADGLAIGEIKVDQVIFDNAVGRDAQYDVNGRQTRGEVKSNAGAAVFLRKRIEQAKNKLRLRQAAMDPAAWTNVHPEERPKGLVIPATTTKRGRGRPRFSGKYTKPLGDEIIRRLCAGEFLTTILKDPGMPSPFVVLDWATDPVTYPEFSLEFACARELQLEQLVAQGEEILTNPGRTETVITRIGPDGETVEVRREVNIAHAKALAEYKLKAAAMLDGGRRRARMDLAILEKAMGMDDDDPDGDGSGGFADTGPVEVIVRGGTPKG